MLNTLQYPEATSERIQALWKMSPTRIRKGSLHSRFRVGIQQNHIRQRVDCGVGRARDVRYGHFSRRSLHLPFHPSPTLYIWRFPSPARTNVFSPLDAALMRLKTSFDSLSVLRYNTFPVRVLWEDGLYDSHCCQSSLLVFVGGG